MDSKELIQRSPLRALDDSLEGGLERGALGLVVARHGAGKTPFLVCVALDHLLRGDRVLHVSLDAKVDHVREYYDQIYEELVRGARLDDPRRVHLEMERGRSIQSYLAGSFSVDKLRGSMSLLRDHAEFRPDLVVVDGYDFAAGEVSEVRALMELAAEAGAVLWMTAIRHREQAVSDADGVPPPADRYKDAASVVVELRTQDSQVRISLLKPRGGELPFVLDPTTMLVKQKA